MMKAGSMEAFLGATTNLSLINTPMKCYKDAERRGDKDAMKRSMNLANEYEGEADKYSEKLGEETVKEAKEARKEQELERQKAIAKARRKNKLEREQAINNIEKPDVQPTETADANGTEKKQPDSVEISDQGKAVLTEQMLSSEVDLLVQNTAEIYSGSARAKPLEQPQPAVMDVKV